MDFNRQSDKKLFKKPWVGWEGVIKTDAKETVCKGDEWIQLAQWRILVNRILNPGRKIRDFEISTVINLWKIITRWQSKQKWGAGEIKRSRRSKENMFILDANRGQISGLPWQRRVRLKTQVTCGRTQKHIRTRHCCVSCAVRRWGYLNCHNYE